MQKKQLLEYVEQIANNTRLGEILSDKEARGNLGKTQFRSVAELCEKADCYEEIKLLIQYKVSKGNGWDEVIATNQKCGDVILRYMEKIKEHCNGDDSETLRNLALFFGYLYWKAAVLIKAVADRSNYENLNRGRR
ncbi:MAG: hypothetical protein N3B21_05985 [Clostridia bacterium]|nr:hypothetical protein [Clostridia bacterium]